MASITTMLTTIISSIRVNPRNFFMRLAPDAHRRPMPQDCSTNCVDSISVYGAAGKGRMRETTDDVGGTGATNMLVESRSMAMTTAGRWDSIGTDALSCRGTE